MKKYIIATCLICILGVGFFLLKGQKETSSSFTNLPAPSNIPTPIPPPIITPGVPISATTSRTITGSYILQKNTDNISKNYTLTVDATTMHIQICNNISVQYTEKETTLMFGPGSRTRMFCQDNGLMELEDSITELFSGEKPFTLTQNELVIQAPKGGKYIFEKKK